MIRKNLAKALRAGLCGALLAASAAAALTPGWAATLKAQSYAGYVDLKVGLSMADGARVRHASAGADLDLLVSLRNDGPADAHRARAIASLQGAATPSATSGCQEDPVGFPGCTLADPLPAGGTADYLMRFGVSPLARGTLNIAVAAASDDPDTEPGQEIVQLQLPVDAHVDLSSSARCNRGYLPTNKPVSCQVTFRNDGRAAALTPYLDTYTYLSYEVLTNCAATRQDLCPLYAGGWYGGVMMPGDFVTLTMDLHAFDGVSTEISTLYFYVTPNSNNEIEDNSADNSGQLTLPVPIFRDDFEGDPPPLQ